MLIDTPEDIGVACDRQGISEIKYLSISHKDPDHTRGIRLIEPLGYDCIADKGTLIQFIALPEDVIGLVSDEGILKAGTALDNAPFRDDMYTIGKVIEMKHRFRIKRIIITHIDEYWGKSYAYNNNSPDCKVVIGADWK